MLDTHCHILPAFDDGSTSAEETLRMLDEAAALGVTELVCTPHCYSSRFDPSQVCELVGQWTLEAQQRGIALHQGCEVHIRALADRGLEGAHDLCFVGREYLLLEFSPEAMPVNWREVIEILREQGITPIIAHPEVYHPVQRDVQVAYALKEAGCLLQLSGRYFGAAGLTHKWHRTGVKLLKAGLVDFVGSDAHRTGDYAHFRQALKKAEKHGFAPRDTRYWAENGERHV